MTQNSFPGYLSGSYIGACYNVISDSAYSPYIPPRTGMNLKNTRYTDLVLASNYLLIHYMGSKLYIQPDEAIRYLLFMHFYSNCAKTLFPQEEEDVKRQES